jgi:GMP synthase PP-ATPase subunit
MNIYFHPGSIKEDIKRPQSSVKLRAFVDADFRKASILHFPLRLQNKIMQKILSFKIKFYKI